MRDSSIYFLVYFWQNLTLIAGEVIERMFTIRYAEERGGSDLDWLDSKHTFSFGHYYDSASHGF